MDWEKINCYVMKKQHLTSKRDNILCARVGRWWVKKRKISHSLYEKIDNKTEFNQKIGEMEEFIRK